MYHESFVAPFWKSRAGRLLRHACFPLVAWACVGINAVRKGPGEELVVMLRTDSQANCADAHPPRPYTSSNLTISSSPKYAPDCTSMISRSSFPGFSSRCRSPIGM